MLLPVITFLDLETTGATPLKDRITEIALVRFEYGREVARWQTLVNPETSIPPFIQNLTGITQDMVADAPTFAEVATQLLEYLDGAVMAAHNARFDHGFLKSEYRRLGHILRQKVLCTVKLSRTLYPEYKSHGLDAIMARHQFTASKRHRAMSDVELMIAFVEAAQQQFGAEHVSQTARALSKHPSLPSHIDPTIVDKIPETPGVYLFYGENQLPLYIGKSINLRERILSHFSADHASTKEMRLSQELKHIEWIETAGELGALLLESKLIKSKQPIYNRQLRRERQLCTWRILEEEATPQVKLVRQDDITPSDLASLYGVYRSKKHAEDALRNIAEAYQLCPKLLGLEQGKGRCFASQLNKCNGACYGNESKSIHRLRLMQALAAQRLVAWPYDGMIVIKEVCQVTAVTDVHLFDQWCHLGTVHDESDYHTLLEQPFLPAFDYDTYKLLLKSLRHWPYQIIQSNQPSSMDSE